MAKATYTAHIDWDGDGNFNQPGDNVTADLISCYIDHSFSSPLARVSQVTYGNMVLDNQSRRYSPPMSACAVPRRRCRLTMDYAGASAVLFDAFVQRISPHPGKYRSRRVTVEWADAMTILDTEEGSISASLNVTADHLIDHVVRAVYAPTSTCYDAGLNVFPVSADRWSYAESLTHSSTPKETLKASDKIMDVCKADWGRFFIDKQGRPNYANRHRMTLNDTVALTLDDEMVEMGYQMQSSDIYNRIEVTCHPRVIGLVPEVLGKLRHTTAQKIDPSGSQLFDIRYQDPSNIAKDVGGYDIQNLIQGKDYIAYQDESGQGSDVSAHLSVSLSSFGDRAQIKVANTSSSPLFLKHLQVRGTIIRSMEPVTVISEDANSISTYQRRKLRLDMPLMATRPAAESLCDYLLVKYKDPQHDVHNVTIAANADAKYMAAARDLELLDRVEVTETQTGLTAYGGYIYRLVHRIHEYDHKVSMWLQTRLEYPAPLFRIDVSQINGAHVIVY